MPDLESHWLAERFAYLGRTLTGDAVWRRKASRTFPRLKSDPKAKGRCKLMVETPFVRECRAALRNLAGSSDLPRPRKELYWELVVGSASDLLSEWYVWAVEEIRSMELGARNELLEPRVLAHLATGTERIAPSRVGLQSGPGRHAPDCARWGSGLEETTEHAFYYWEWRARIEPKQLVLLDVGYVVDNVLPPFQGEKCVVFLAILAVARMVIWTTRKRVLYDDANFSHRDLVLCFRHHLRVKVWCDRKQLDRITFDKRWVNATCLVVQKGVTLESSFPLLPAHGVYGTSPLGPHPG